MAKTIIAVWIYLCGLFGVIITAGVLAQVLAAFHASQLEAYGPVVPAVARIWATDLLPHAPTVLGSCAAISVAAGVYLWRSRRPLDTRRFAAAVIAACNLFLAMYFTTLLLLAYFYLPKVANAA